MISTVLPGESLCSIVLQSSLRTQQCRQRFLAAEQKVCGRERVHSSQKAITETFAEVSFYAFSKTGSLFHTFQIFLYFSADACRTPTFVWFEAWIKIPNQCLEAKGGKKASVCPRIKIHLNLRAVNPWNSDAIQNVSWTKSLVFKMEHALKING